MSRGASTPTLPPGLPDDWVMDHDVFCPTCSYNLRMLHLPRCPECGLVFRWQALLTIRCPRCGLPLGDSDADTCPRCRLPLNWPRLLDTAAAVDRSLYEYSRRPVRAAIRTWFAALRPWHFWSRIPVESPPAVARLRSLMRAAFAVLATGLALAVFATWDAWGNSSLGFAGLLVIAGAILSPVALTLCLPLVTIVGLPTFIPTLARFRVRGDQMLRCLSYACAGLAWLGILFIAAAGLALILNALSPPLVGPLGGTWVMLGSSISIVLEADYFVACLFRVDFSPGWFPFQHWFNLALGGLILAIGFVWWWAFLWIALRRYLRLDRKNALALLVSTQLAGLLLLSIVLVTAPTATREAAGQLMYRLELWLK